jgi:branched-chain amino acid transport system substrate-binding protein
MNTSAGFLEPVAAVPGGVTDGLYAAAGFPDLYSRAADPVPAIYVNGFSDDAGISLYQCTLCLFPVFLKTFPVKI